MGKNNIYNYPVVNRGSEKRSELGGYPYSLFTMNNLEPRSHLEFLNHVILSDLFFSFAKIYGYLW